MLNKYVFKFLFFCGINLFFISQVNAQLLPGKIPFSGVLYDNSNNPIVDASVTLTLGVYNPAETCLLYEETQNLSTSATAGRFSVLIGNGARTGNDSAHTMQAVFSNNTGANIAGIGTCPYTPAVGDSRKLKVTVAYTAHSAEVLSPLFTIAPQATALVADSFSDGSMASSFVKINTIGVQLSQSNLENVFSSTNYPTLTGLLAGTSNLYAKSDSTMGTRLVASSSDPTSASAGSLWYDTTTNQLKFHNGTTSQTISAGGAGLTSLNSETASVQTLAIGTSGLTPAFSSSGGVHTLNIPMASSAGVTAGLISKIDYDNFNNPTDVKITNAFTGGSSKLGLGTVGPTYKLQVQDTSGYSAKFETTGTNASSDVLIVDADSLSSRASLQVQSQSGAKEVFWAGANGSVGIGTASPLSPDKLTINHDSGASVMRFINNITTTGLQIGVNSAGDGWISMQDATKPIRFLTNASERLIITPSGNIGIGTPTPSDQLHILGTGANLVKLESTGSVVDLLMSHSGGSSKISVDNSGGSHISFDSGNNGTDMVIQNNGNVGIGIASPAYKLEVLGDISISGTPYRMSGDIAWQVPSDARLKNVIGSYDRGLLDISRINLVRYHYKTNNPVGADSTKEYVGVLAQEVQEIIPEAVSKESKTGFLSLNTTPIFWSMVNAVKDLNKLFSNLENKIDTIQNSDKSELNQLKAENAELRARVERLESLMLQK